MLLWLIAIYVCNVHATIVLIFINTMIVHDMLTGLNGIKFFCIFILEFSQKNGHMAVALIVHYMYICLEFLIKIKSLVGYFTVYHLQES